MSVWKDLALRALETEFPAFEFCQAFSVLRLGKQRDLEVTPDTYNTHLQRLANYVGEPPETLHRQIAAFKPGAAAAYNAASITTLQAWRDSIFRDQLPGHQLRCRLCSAVFKSLHLCSACALGNDLNSHLGFENGFRLHWRY